MDGADEVAEDLRGINRVIDRWGESPSYDDEMSLDADLYERILFLVYLFLGEWTYRKISHLKITASWSIRCKTVLGPNLQSFLYHSYYSLYHYYYYYLVTIISLLLKKKKTLPVTSKQKFTEKSCTIGVKLATQYKNDQSLSEDSSASGSIQTKTSIDQFP